MMVCFKFLARLQAKLGVSTNVHVLRRMQCVSSVIVVTLLTAPPAGAAGSLQSSAPRYSSGNSQPIQCLSSGDGYLRARLSGAINAELDWHNKMSCEGSVRPGGGLRLRFSRLPKDTHNPLALLFGINGIGEGQNGKVLAVNVTIIREGKGEFFSTQGDKCVIDELRQTIIPGMPTRKRSYRVEAHGFCNQPARALNGEGSVLVTRFDFAGRIDLTVDDDGATDSKIRS